MKIFSLIFKQTSFQVLGKVVTSLSTFIILSLIARFYGKEDLGTFTLALTYLGVFMMVADFGFNGHLLKQVQSVRQVEPQSGTKFKAQSEIFKKLLGTRIIWAVVLVVLSILLLPLFSFSGMDFMQLSIAGSFSLIGFALFVTSNLIFQKNLRYDFSTVATVLGTLVYLFLVLFSGYNSLPLISLSLSSMTGWLVIGFTALFLVRKITGNILPDFDLGFSISLVKKTWLIAGTLFLNVIYFRADAFFITFYKGLADAGVYNLAYQFFQVALVLPAFIMNSYYPILLKSYAGLRKVIFSLLGLSFLGIILTFLLSPFLIPLLAGAGYEGSIASLKILSLGFPAFFISALFMWMLVAEGKYMLMFVLYTSVLILNLVLNSIFVPVYSYIGASYVTIASEYVILFFQLFLLRKIIRHEN